jgi:tetratricopeptide (TPR) repeat protein
MKVFRAIAICTILLGLVVADARGAGGSRQPSGSTSSSPAKTPAEEAIEHYNMGLSMRDRAWKYEEKASQTTDPEKREKLHAKAVKQYHSAVREFQSATRRDPMHYQAYSELGYASRKLGEYEEALRAYDRALELEPGYTEAIEYRGEAYLGLNRLEDAKQAYMELFGADRPKADQLLQAMKSWVERRQADPGDLGDDVVDAFASWVEEREQLAAQTASLSPGSTGKW